MSETTAIDLLKRAVQLDQEQKYPDALTCYSESIRLLLKIVKEIPTNDERKRDAYRQKITECMDRAEALKNLIDQQKVKTLHEQIQIKDGSIGNSYEKLFKRFLDQNVTQITVEDPYIRAFHQISNFVRFCEVIIKLAVNIKQIDLITTYESSEQAKKTQIDQLDQLKEHISNRHSIHLTIKYVTGLHDREIRLNNGWIIKIGRGLDFYKPPECKLSIGYYDLDLRPCHQTTIDIFHSERVQSST